MKFFKKAIITLLILALILVCLGAKTFYDAGEFKEITPRLDGQTVYVAATVGRKIYVYNRNRDTGDLSLRSTIAAETGVDNIGIDQRGDLWVGCHPKLLTFVNYSKNPEVLSPSQVIKVENRVSGRYEIKEVYMSNGQPLSGSSVAAVFEDTLLIGSVFDERFLMCNLPN